MLSGGGPNGTFAPFNFVNESIVNYIGLGKLLGTINGTKISLSIYQGGTFDAVGFNVTPTCTGGTPPCTSLLNQPNGTTGSMNTTATGMLFSSQGTQLPVSGPGLNPVPMIYENSQAFPNEYGNQINANSLGGSVPAGSY
jgi:hypothetical protein